MRPYHSVTAPRRTNAILTSVSEAYFVYVPVEWRVLIQIWVLSEIWRLQNKHLSFFQREGLVLRLKVSVGSGGLFIDTPHFPPCIKNALSPCAHTHIHIELGLHYSCGLKLHCSAQGRSRAQWVCGWSRLLSSPLFALCVFCTALRRNGNNPDRSFSLLPPLPLSGPRWTPSFLPPEISCYTRLLACLVWSSFICLIVCLFVSLLVRPFVSLFVWPFVSLLVRPFVSLFVWPFVSLLVLFVWSFVRSFVLLFACLFVHLVVSFRTALTSVTGFCPS